MNYRLIIIVILLACCFRPDILCQYSIDTLDGGLFSSVKDRTEGVDALFCSSWDLEIMNSSNHEGEWLWAINYSGISIPITLLTKKPRYHLLDQLFLEETGVYEIRIAAVPNGYGQSILPPVPNFGPPVVVEFWACCGAPAENVPIVAEYDEPLKRHPINKYVTPSDSPSNQTEFKLQFPFEAAAEWEFEILNSAGKVVLRKEHIAQESHIIDLSDFRNGPYRVNAESEKRIFSEHFELDDPSKMSYDSSPSWVLHKPDRLGNQICSITAEENRPLPFELSVLDLSGKTLIAKTCESRTVELDVSDLPAGVYVANLNSAGIISTSRLEIPRKHHNFPMISE